MKKIVGLCLAVILCTGSAFAAPDRQKDKRQDRMQQRCERMVSELKLNEQQAADFRRINEEFRAKMMKERESMETMRTEMRQKMKTLMEEKNAEVKKVLTDEQYKQYLEKQRKMDRRERDGKNRRGW